jgi:hypothetical protein
MSEEQWELASTSKEPFEVYYGREDDIKTILGSAARPVAHKGSGDKK